MQVDRHASLLVAEALADTPIVVVQGARQVGKSTLASELLASRGLGLLTLDDSVQRAAAAADPDGFVDRGESCVGIDEVQLEPSLIRAIKASVDRDRAPGRFLLTGSADLLRVAGVQESLAGRAETIELEVFSQGEVAGIRESLIDRAFAGETIAAPMRRLSRNDYLERIVIGGYPEVIARPSARRRRQWFANYVERIVRRDIPDIVELRRDDVLNRLLRLFAARGVAELNVAQIGSELGVPATTLPRYVDSLRTVYLISELPAWSRNLGARVVRRPKYSVSDTGLAASLINVDAQAMSVGSRGSDAAGGLVEAFVIAELRRSIAWSETRPVMHYFRDRGGREIDIILEAPDGRVVAIEVKASTSVSNRDFRHLRWLGDTIGDDFVAGLVLNTGHVTERFGDRLAVAPISSLWSDT